MMKKSMIILICLYLAAAVSAQQADVLKNEKEAIRETALNYLEGWFTADAERMDKALHPDLVKRAVGEDRQSGEVKLIFPATKAQMVEWTRNRSKDKRPKEEWGIEVKIFEILKYSASDRTTCSDFIDYIHMVKIDGQWKILNVVWEFPEKK